MYWFCGPLESEYGYARSVSQCRMSFTTTAWSNSWNTSCLACGYNIMDLSSDPARSNMETDPDGRQI